jgi:AmmeMemoRadiSam system protein B
MHALDASARPARPPAIAGRFYPARPADLAELADACVEDTPMLEEPPLGLLVPHAGLVFSGTIAGRAWGALGGAWRAAGIEHGTALIAGTNHFAGWIDGLAVWDGGPWDTPLGRVDVDVDLSARVLALGDGVSAQRAAHSEEHSIEVQLPLLQRAAPGGRIVPFLVADASPRTLGAARRLGELLADRRAAGDPLVLVASSDFAHYPSARRSEEVNHRLLEPICSLDEEALGREEAALRRAGIPGLACGMCGIDPTRAVLAALRAAGATRATVLAQGTSADVPWGDVERTVGYASVAFFA